MTRIRLVLMRVSQALLLATIFSVPVAVLPWTTDIFETNKQAIYIIGIGLALSGFALSHALDHGGFRRPGLVVLAPLFILLATIFSAAKSVAPAVSWLGLGAQAYVSVLSVFGFVGAFYLTLACLKQPNMRPSLILALFSGSACVSLAFWPIWLGLPTGTFTNLIGTPHAFGIYLLLMGTIACGFWLTDAVFDKTWQQRWFQTTAVITFVTAVVVLLALDSITLWWLCFAGTGLLFLIALLHADKFHSYTRLIPTMTLFILATVFLILPAKFPSPFLPEVTPNASTTWGVVTGAWNEGSVLWGTGPGTFSLVYPKYVSLAVNQSDFWDLVFDRGDSHITTQLATTGILGVVTWVFFICLITVLAGKKIVKADADWKQVAPWFAGWFVLTLSSCVYTQNFTLSALFWTISALLANFLVVQDREPFHDGTRARLAGAFTAAVVAVGFVLAVLMTAPPYLAEVAFAKAVQHDSDADTAGEVDEVISLLDKAATLNSRNDAYYRNLAGALLRRVSVLTPDEITDDEYVQSLIVATLEAAERATTLSPGNVMNWEVRGLIYRELLGVVPDAAEPATAAYERAIELAPVNPRYRVEAGRAYLAIADAQTPLLQNADAAVATEALAAKTEAINKAEEHFKIAMTLKNDYTPAHYYYALLKGQQGNLAEAVSGLEFVKKRAPDDIGVGLQLGLLYLRQGKNDLARLEFERVISLAPDYADAHWYLAVAFEQAGDLSAAIQEVEQVLANNPDNVAVQSRLDRLKAGLVSSNIPGPIIQSAQ